MKLDNVEARSRSRTKIHPWWQYKATDPSLVVIVRVSLAGTKHHGEKQPGEECFVQPMTLSLHFSTQEVRAGTEGRYLEAGTKAETIEEYGLPACLCSHSLLNWLSYIIQGHYLGLAPPTVGWALLRQSWIKKMIPWTYPWASLVGAFSQMRFPLLRLASVKLTKTSQHTSSSTEWPKVVVWFSHFEFSFLGHGSKVLLTEVMSYFWWKFCLTSGM